jgi:hypothetical protein
MRSAPLPRTGREGTGSHDPENFFRVNQNIKPSL